MSIFGFSKKHTKNYMTIEAENKGQLTKFKHFSFGNGCKKELVGYVTMFPAEIISMSISCDRPQDLEEVIVAISIDGYVKNQYSVTLNNGEINKYVRFNNPLKVKEGSSLNFVSLENTKTICTIVGVVLET